MDESEILERSSNAAKFVASLHPPGGLTASKTADWQLIVNSALGLLNQIDLRCPSSPLKVEAASFVMRAVSAVTGSFVAKG